jgi:glycosyltransferase involved in cell wall biosynthesis
MAMGKPIVATEVGGNPEVVQDGVNGFIVPRRDAASLQDALIRICRDDLFRRRAQRVNRSRFESDFSLTAMVNAHERLYEEVAKSR